MNTIKQRIDSFVRWGDARNRYFYDHMALWVLFAVLFCYALTTFGIPVWAALLIGCVLCLVGVFITGVQILGNF